MIPLKDFQTSLQIIYKYEEIEKNNLDIEIPGYSSIEDYKKSNPEKDGIKVDRKIIRIIGKNTVLLDKPFPLPRAESKFDINLVNTF